MIEARLPKDNVRFEGLIDVNKRKKERRKIRHCCCIKSVQIDVLEKLFAYTTTLLVT